MYIFTMKNTKVQFVIGLVLTVFFLYIAFRNVSFADLLDSLRKFNWWIAIPYLIVAWLGFYFRAVRWKYLLLPTKTFTSSRLFSPLVAGFGLNNLFPARLGEFARAYILSKNDQVPFMTGLGTVIIERLFDMLMLLALLPVALFSTEIPHDFNLSYSSFSISGAMLSTLIKQLTVFFVVLFILAFTFLIPQVRNFYEWSVTKLVFIPIKYRQLLIRLFHSFTDGLQTLKTPKTWFAVIFYSAAVWIACGASYYILVFGFDNLSMSFSQSIAVMVITCLAIILPAAPGFWGLMELGIMFGLLVLSIVPNDEIGRSQALAYAFMNHFLVYVTIVVAGLYYLWREQIKITDINQAKGNANSDDTRQDS